MIRPSSAARRPWVAVRRLPEGEVLVPRARWCDAHLCKLRGLTFRRALPPEEGLVLVEARDSRLGAGIHMLCVFFPIAVIWIDSQGDVVDVRLARPFVPAYLPRRPARYILEGVPALLERVQVGDRLEFMPL